MSTKIQEFNKIPNPSVLPSNQGNGVAFSPDGVYMVTAKTTTPFIAIYKKNGTTFDRLPNPSVLPTGTGNGVAFSPDGQYLSIVHGTTPFLTIYKRSGDTFTKLANPATLPAFTGLGVTFSADGIYMSVSHSSSPFITIYKRNGDTFTKLANPTTLPTGGNCVSFSPDGNYMVVGVDNIPRFVIYKRSGDTFTKLADPTTLPPANTKGLEFSPDGQYLSVAHSTTPFVTIYKRSGDTFTKLANPSVLPTGTGNGVAFSPDGKYMAVVHQVSPFVTIYKKDEDIFTKTPDSSVLPTGTGNGVAFSPDGQYMTVGHATTPFITIYHLPTMTTVKHFIKSSNKIHISSDGKLVYPNLTTPTQADFELWGMDGLDDYASEVSVVNIEMDEDGVLGDGRVIRKTINKNDFKINRLEYDSINQTKVDRVLMPKYGVARFKMDETSGNVLDSKGSNIGTATGTTIIETPYGNGRRFGLTSNNYIDFTSTVIPSGKQSIRFKIRMSILPTATQIVFDTNGVNALNKGMYCALDVDGSMNIVTLAGSGVWENYPLRIVSLTNICDSQWHDILFTWDGTTSIDGVKLYIDDMDTPNVTDTATTTTLGVHSHNLRIGCSRYTDTTILKFGGDLDEFEVYNDVINPFAKFNLIKSSDKIQSLISDIWTDTSLTEPLIQENFETYGMGNITSISYDKWMELDDGFEIITFTNETEISSKFLEITTDSFSPLAKLNQESEFEILTYTDANELKTSQATSVEDTIDSGKLFIATLEDFASITGVEVV